jgi:trehalose-6-phosphate hydrolase
MLLVVNNFYGEDTLFKLPEDIAIGEYNKQILISNYNDSSQELTEFTLRPYESICYLLEKNVRI